MFLPVLPAETGGICISPRPSEEGAEILPCMAMRPLFGIVPVLMDEKVSLPVHMPRHPLASAALPRRAAPTAGSPLRGESSGQLPLGHLSCSCLRPGSLENARWSLLLSPHLPGLQGNVLKGGDVSGALCLSQAWPGMARTIFGDHQRFMDAYFKAYPGEPFLPPLDLVSEPFPRGRGLRERSLLSLPLSQERSSSGFSQGLRPWAPRRRAGRHLGDNRGGSRPPPGLHVVVFWLVSCRLVGVHVHVCPWEPMLCSRKQVSDTFGEARVGSLYLLLPDVCSLLLSGSPSALYWHQLSSTGEVSPWGVVRRQGGFGASSCPGGVPHGRVGAPLGPSSELVLNPPLWCRLLLHRRRGLPN